MTGGVTDRPSDDIAAFLAGAGAVLEALSDPRVADAWDSPSVLEGQAVSGLAGHLARGGVWVVADYLAGEEPAGPLTFDSAGAYYARLVEQMGEEAHVAIRRRGAQVGADGHEALVRTLTERLDGLAPLLAGTGPERRLAVIGGAVLRLGDYLRTRIVEQVVHLGDLARSVGAEDWSLPADCVATALAVGVEIGRIRFGDQELVRALFRHTGSDVLPVL